MTETTPPQPTSSTTTTTPSSTQPTTTTTNPTQLKCVHCGVTSTPLWRAGPAGPKTLCNACGVRWKKTGSVVPRAKRTISKSSRKESSNNTTSIPTRTTVQAPHPVRVHDESYGRTYESVFAGLMEVPRGSRSRTRTPRAQLFFDGIARASAAPSPPPVLNTSNATSPPAVYVTETLAPSPSPSPPPLPRMEPFPEGQGFRLVMHVKPDRRDETAQP